MNLSPDLLALLSRRDLSRTLCLIVDATQADGTPEPVYLSTTSGVVTEPEDVPASTPFEARLLPGRRWVQSITDGSAFGGGARPFSMDFDIDNRDGRFDPLLDPAAYTVRGRSVIVSLGGTLTVEGKPFPWSSFCELGTAVVTSWGRSTSDRARLHMTLSGMRALDDRPAVDTVWGGWGGGLQLELSAERQTWATAEDAPHLDLGPSFTVGWTGRLLPEGAGGWRAILLKGASVADCQYGFGVLSSLKPVILSRGGYGGTGEPLPVGERIGLCLRVQTVDGVSTAELWTRTPDGTFLPVIEPVAIPTPSAVTGPLQIGRAFAMQSFVLYEAWGASRLLDEAEARQWMARPLNGDEDELQFLYKAEDRTGTTSVDELGRSPLTLTGDPPWMSSLEGDDPTRFETGTAGMTSGRVIGPCRSVKAQVVDSSGGWYRWSDKPSAPPSVVYSEGVPVVQDVDLESSKIAIDTTENALSGPRGTFARLVPGQSDPYRPGQRIDLMTDSGLNDSTYEIAAEGINHDLSTCRLVEPLATSEIAGQSVTLRSTSPQVFIDAERSALSTDGGMTPPGDLVVDVVGDPDTLHTASAQYALWSGRTVESVLEWDPVLAVATPAGPPVARAEILRRILDSCHAWARELPDGTIRLGNWPLPEGETVGRLERFRRPPSPLSTVPPYWTIAVGYGRVWHPLSQTAESLSASERERLQTPFRWVDDPRPEVRNAHATAGELRLETYLPDLAGARELLRRLVALHGEPRAFWELSPGPEVLQYQPGERLMIVSDGPFAQGRPLVVTHIDLDPVGSQAVLRGYR